VIDDCPDGDTYFPPVDWSQWHEVRREDRDGFAFVDYVRR
jgi:dihydrofolate reductase